MIGIIAAMDVELELLLSKLKKVKKRGDYYEGKLEGVKAVLALSGVGKINAAVTTALMIERYKPSLIINTGVAGGINRSAIMDVVIAEGVVQHDFDLTVFGCEKGALPDMEERIIPADEKALEKAKRVLTGVKCGIIASGDQFIASDEKAEEIAEEFGAAACDMESAAIGYTAFKNKTPFLIVRTISDGGNDEGGGAFTDFVTDAANKNSNAVLEIVKAFA